MSKTISVTLDARSNRQMNAASRLQSSSAAASPSAAAPSWVTPT